MMVVKKKYDETEEDIESRHIGKHVKVNDPSTPLLHGQSGYIDACRYHPLGEKYGRVYRVVLSDQSIIAKKNHLIEVDGYWFSIDQIKGYSGDL